MPSESSVNLFLSDYICVEIYWLAFVTEKKVEANYAFTRKHYHTHIFFFFIKKKKSDFSVNAKYTSLMSNEHITAHHHIFT